MNRLSQSAIRTSSFLRKEAVEVLREPRLLLTLVLGPFLILLLFGIGFRQEPQAFRTLFVAPPDSELRGQIEKYANSLGPNLDFVGIIDNAEAGFAELRAGRVDIFVIAPQDIYETLRRNERPIFQVFHNNINPLESHYIRSVGRIYVDEVNRRILQNIAAEAQSQAATSEQHLSKINDVIGRLRQAIDQGDNSSVRAQVEDLVRAIDNWVLTLDATLPLFNAVDQAVGTNISDRTAAVGADLRRSVDSLQQISADLSDVTAQKVADLQDELNAVESRLREFEQFNPGTLVNMFGTETRYVAGNEPTFPQFYTPAVIALLLQHLCITLGGLSIVRDHWTGTMELFSVAPITASEILLSKYASYVALSGLVAAALSVLVVLGLDVPMVGSWAAYALVVFALSCASIGAGFIISLLANSVSQAVQYAMIVLIASVFFTGFFQDLERFRVPVQIIARFLPATYGIRLLQNIMLRGELSPVEWLYYLAAFGVGLFGIAWLLLRRAMKSA
jgi:ABC-2 type transport system permease protein